MTEDKILGIVLTGLRYGENQRIMKILTRSHGLLSFIIRAERAKKKGSRTALYQPFTIVHIDAQLSQRSNLHKIRECSLATSTAELHTNPAKTAQAIFLAELLSKIMEEGEENQQLFDYVCASIEWLNEAEVYGAFHISIALGLTGFLGFYPQGLDSSAFFDMREGMFCDFKPLHSDCLSGSASIAFHRICGMNLDAMSDLKMTKEEKNGLLNDLLTYYQIQLEHFKQLNSHLILQETFY